MENIERIDMKLYLIEKSYISSYLNDLSEIKAKALIGSDFKTKSKSYEINNGEAIIQVSGPLQRSPSFFSWIFNSSTYDEIGKMTIEASQDPDVKGIAYMINSPGGEVDGIDSLGQIIKAVDKPTVSYVDNMATSAAYWIASQTDKIVATSPTAEFGSIGVIVAGLDFTGIYEKMGAKMILISSTDAPEKKNSYQLTTKAGEKSTIKRLDALHQVFASRVAQGRNTTIENVNENFGRGGVVSAKEALTKGMIDNILNEISLQITENTEKDIVSSKTKERNIKMDKTEMQDKHPELLSQIEKESFDKGAASGAKTERKRVDDLNAWRGKSDSCDAIVDEAIKNGSQYSDVMSKLHASLPEKTKVDKDPPPIAGNPDTKIVEGDEKITEDQMTKIGKEIAQGIGGNNG